MSRKRLIKLLMAQGWSRNSANRLANSCRNSKVNHRSVYYISCLTRVMLPHLIDAVADYVVSLAVDIAQIQPESGDDNN